MQRKSLVILSILIITIIGTSSVMLPAALAQTQGNTLANALNATVTNINWQSANSWTATWGAILGGQGLSAIDSAINSDVASGNWNDALYVARIADINGYTSQTITSGTQTALNNMPMAGSLPNNYNAKSYGDPNTASYLVYDRYLMWAYQYAQQNGLTNKWNTNQAFTDLAKLYNLPPKNSRSGEMLIADPVAPWAYSYSSRYYDEYAETMNVFVQLAKMGVPGAINYADSMWASLQTLWNGKYYVYNSGQPIVECESGNFAQIIAEYMQLKGGTIPYWNRVLNDLDYKLLANGWSSPGWSTAGVIVHATTNSEQRLWETMGVITTLQALYPYFNSTMKNQFNNLMLSSSKPWQGLMNSQLNVGGVFRGTSTIPVSNDATICAAATLFLEGIVPVTGSLDIHLTNLAYQDHRTSFPISQFGFNYANRQITVPVTSGQITFTYGSTPVSYTFTTPGVYTIGFSNDWNAITSINGAPITTAPTAPQNLAASAGNGQISLSWSTPTFDGNSPITAYNLYSSNIAGSETFLKSVDATTTSFTDAPVTNGATYFYKVTAVNAVGESTKSNEASAVPSAPATSLVVSGFPSQAIAGTAASFTVTAKDANGNTATNYLGTISFASSDTAAMLPATYTFTANDKGTHTFSATLNSQGTQSITATDTQTLSITGTQSGISVNNIKTLSTTVSTSKASYSKGDNIPITVTVKDPVTAKLLQGATVTIKVINPNSATMATSTKTTDANGQVSYTYRLTGNPAKGVWTIDASATLTGYQKGAAQSTFSVS